ncbi:MAG: hypothetical protein ACK5MR_15420 [Cumulibacter sp.]
MSRSAAIWAAVSLIAVLFVFTGVSILTSNAAWFLWSVVPILSAVAFFLSAIRGETLGERKRARDLKIAERKAAERRARSTTTPQAE